MKYYPISALALLLVVNQPVYAQETLDDSEIVVTATRTTETADETMASVTVITREDIEASQPQDILELLQFQTGIEIGRNGGLGQGASIFLRGTESNHTLVLVDGIRINPGTIGSPSLQNLDPSMIERIEIVRGPRSTLYGSDAIGGVIQIFTRRQKKKSSAQISIGAGSDSTYNTRVSAHNVSEGSQVGLSFSDLSTSGFPTKTAATEDSGHKNRNISAYYGARIDSHEIDISLWSATGNTEYYDFFLSPLDQDFENSTLSLKLKSGLGTHWVSTLRLGGITDKIDQNQSIDFAHTRRKEVDWQNDVQVNRANLLTTGIFHSRENTQAESFGTSFDVDTTTSAFYLQNQLKINKHKLITAWRYTDHETFGEHNTGEITYGYRFNEKYNTWISVSSGFRAPNSTDRFGFGGNPDLDPESSLNYELGTNLKFSKKHELVASLYHNEIDDLIIFVTQTENVEKAQIRGIELDYTFVSRPWKVGLGVTLQDPKNLSSGDRLARRAKRSAKISIGYLRNPYQLSLDVFATSERNDSDFNTVVNDAYTLANLTAKKYLTKQWSLGARIENVFDEEYVLADGFNTRGKSYFVELRYKQ